MKFLYAAYFWTYFVIVTIVLFIGVMFAHLIEKMLPKHKKRLIHKVACFWGNMLFWGFPIWRLKIEGKEYLPNDDQSYVMVANHLSAGDIFTLCCTDVQFRWLSKASVFKVPLIGTAMGWAGYVPVSRGNKTSHEQAMKASRNWLEQRVSMLFFPEGTRSRSGAMAPFKSGAFRLAEDAKVDILPIALSGTYHMLQKAWPKPSRVTVHVFPPTRRGPEESMDAFIQRVRNLIATKAHP